MSPNLAVASSPSMRGPIAPRDRIWDPEERYTQGALRAYDHWSLEVSYRQHTLGCYILFARRPVEKLSDLAPAELSELAFAMKEIETALGAHPEFRPDRFNYLQLGNFLHHLHVHGIPRYAGPRRFLGREWLDPVPARPPVWSHEDVNHDVVRAVRDALRTTLPA